MAILVIINVSTDCQYLTGLSYTFYYTRAYTLLIRILSSTINFKKYSLDNPMLIVVLVKRCSNGFETGWILESL